MDGTFEGKKFRFVNTHLEVEGNADVQEDQGENSSLDQQRLAVRDSPLSDFNSAADGSTTTLRRSHEVVLRRRVERPCGSRLTCCQNDTLTQLPEWPGLFLDFVFTHGALSSGDAPFQMAPPLWPSDHAGVVATVRIH